MSDSFPINSPFEANFDPDRAQQFIIGQLINAIHTCAVVRILAVTPTAGKVGFVDVMPQIQEVDTNGVVVEQTPIFNVPYLRYQAGPSAIIMDPAVGDVGLAIFAERDISAFKATGAAGPAATARSYSSADGLYIGGVLNADPTQWIKFLPNAAGIDITTPGNLAVTVGGTLNVSVTGAATLSAASWTINGATTFTNNVTAPDVIVPNAHLNTHFHNDPQGGVVGPPHN